MLEINRLCETKKKFTQPLPDFDFPKLKNNLYTEEEPGLVR